MGVPRADIAAVRGRRRHHAVRRRPRLHRAGAGRLPLRRRHRRRRRPRRAARPPRAGRGGRRGRRGHVDVSAARCSPARRSSPGAGSTRPRPRTCSTRPATGSPGGRGGAAERRARRRGPRAGGAPGGRAVRQRADPAPADDRARRHGGLSPRPATPAATRCSARTERRRSRRARIRQLRPSGGPDITVDGEGAPAMPNARAPCGTVRPWPVARRRRTRRRAERPRHAARACRAAGSTSAGGRERCAARSTPIATT